MRRLIRIALVCLLAACSGDSDDRHVGNISIVHDLRSMHNGPLRQTITVELTLPRHSGIDRIHELAAIDHKGRRFRWTRMGLAHSNGEERLHATFEVAGDSELALLQVNEYDVDLRESRMRRARAPRKP